jgi:FeS assembly SUF system protein
MKNLPVLQPPPPDTPAATRETTGLTLDPEKTAALKPAIIKAISTVFDPEIPVNIYELGLIYDILVDPDGVAGIRMTLTAPGCPVAHTLPVEVANKVKAVDGIADARVDIVWEPAWTKDRMSDAAKLQLGMW